MKALSPVAGDVPFHKSSAIVMQSDPGSRLADVAGTLTGQVGFLEFIREAHFQGRKGPVPEVELAGHAG